jgi:hypothetical protein
MAGLRVVQSARRIVREVRGWIAFARWMRETAAFGVLVACPRCRGTGAVPPLRHRYAPWGLEHQGCPDCSGAMFAVRREDA